MERGPEYRVRYGNFLMKKGGKDQKTVAMNRFISMKSQGWWSGELHVHRPLKDVPLLMDAEDLHVAPVITWWNKRNLWEKTSLPQELVQKTGKDRFYHAMAGEDEREGGALLFFNLSKPLPIQGATREYPSPVDYLLLARKRNNIHIDIEKPFWWDVPIWLASGMVDSIGLCNNHQQRDGMLATEAWGKPRDTMLYPNPHGNGQWTQHLYYQILETGHRIPPSAGSASGVLNNPVGYNRVYVYCGKDFSYESWFKGLKEGRVMVTNGPLLRPQVNGALPGHVFKAADGKTVELQPTLNLSIRDPVDYLEVVKNGEVVHEVRLDDYAKARGQLPQVVFEKSGWMLIRAVTSNEKTYRFGSTGPYYVEIGGKRRISRKAAKFFLSWVDERAQRVKIADEKKKGEVLRYHQGARAYWEQVLKNASTD